jgi:hypothetical protein
MSMESCMGKENVVFIYNGILFSLYKERNPTYVNMEEPGGQKTQNKSATGRHIMPDPT